MTTAAKAAEERASIAERSLQRLHDSHADESAARERREEMEREDWRRFSDRKATEAVEAAVARAKADAAREREEAVTSAVSSARRTAIDECEASAASEVASRGDAE